MDIDWHKHSPALFVLLSSFAYIVLILMIVPSVRALRRKSPSDVQMVWYFFSLAFVVTFMVIYWGIDNGAFTSVGDLTGDKGSVLAWILKHFQDLEENLRFVGAVVGILILPQLGSYFLSGLSGCASKPWLVATATDLLYLSVAKFLILNAGIGAAFAVANVIFWQCDWNRIFLYCFSVGVFTPVAFIIIYLQREGPDILLWFEKHCPPRLLLAVQRVHRIACRHRPETPANFKIEVSTADVSVSYTFKL